MSIMKLPIDYGTKVHKAFSDIIPAKVAISCPAGALAGAT